MNKEFEKLCRMSQKQLKNHVKQRLQSANREVITEDGYVFAKGTFPVLLVAHLDTVHKKLPRIIEYDLTQDIISSPNGIGGDDRCGVYMIFKILKKFNCSVLFCEDEEIGCEGSRKFADSELARELDFNYIIEFDRAHANDAVFYQCANSDFEKFITKEFYKTAYGSFTDICEVAPAIGCAAVNLSCGYYAAHTTSEYVVLSEMEKSIEAACAILARTTENDKFEYIEKTYQYSKYYNYVNSYPYSYSYKDEEDDIDDLFCEKYYIIEYTDNNGITKWFDTIAYSREEAIGKFVMEFSNIPFDNVTDIMVDSEMSQYM